MKIKIWTFIQDLGDGSSRTLLYSSEEAGRTALNLDDDDFEPGGEIPIEIDYVIFDTANCEVIS